LTVERLLVSQEGLSFMELVTIIIIIIIIIIFIFKNSIWILWKRRVSKLYLVYLSFYFTLYFPQTLPVSSHDFAVASVPVNVMEECAVAFWELQFQHLLLRTRQIIYSLVDVNRKRRHITTLASVL
jgi:hypothetical protein